MPTTLHYRRLYILRYLSHEIEDSLPQLPGTKSILQTLAHFAESLAPMGMGKLSEQHPSMLPMKRKASDSNIVGLARISMVAHASYTDREAQRGEDDISAELAEETPSTVLKKKRTRLPPMASMTRFEEVVLDFPFDVRAALARIQSPAAFFSTCSLDIFKRHMKFGKLGNTTMFRGLVHLIFAQQGVLSSKITSHCRVNRSSP